MTPLDGLLAELASGAMDFQRGEPTQVSFAQILKSLRDRYAIPSKLDEVELAGSARSVLTSVAKSLSKLESDDSRALFNEFVPSEQESILGKMARRSVQNPQEVISAGRFLEYASGKTLLRFFEAHPELFFDGRFWDVPYASLDFGVPSATEEARTQLLRYYASLLADAVWLADQDTTDLEETSRPRLLRAALALELLEPSSDQDGQ